MHLDAVDKWWTCHIFVTEGGGQLLVLSQFRYRRGGQLFDPVTISLQQWWTIVELSQFRYRRGGQLLSCHNFVTGVVDNC